MSTFIVRNSGVIRTRIRSDLSMAIEHSGTGYVEFLIRRVCENGRGYWNQKHRNWLVYAEHTAYVLQALQFLAIQFHLNDDIPSAAPHKVSLAKSTSDLHCVCD